MFALELNMCGCNWQLHSDIIPFVFLGSKKIKGLRGTDGATLWENKAELFHIPKL